jgi:two-component system, NarL family, sensor kinase
MANIRFCFIFLLIFHVILFTGSYFGVCADVNVKKSLKSLTDSIEHFDSIIKSNKVLNDKLAIANAKKALSYARQINTPLALVRAYIMNGIAYKQNHEDSSYFYFNMASKLADIGKFTREKIRALYNLANLKRSIYDYKTALILLDSAVRMAESIKDYTGMSNAYNEKGNINMELQDLPNARSMYEMALKIGKSHSLFPQMGIALGNLSKFEPDSAFALRKMVEALNLFKDSAGYEEEASGLMINIGWNQQNPDSALFYYRSALQQGIRGNLPEVVITAYNNMAYSYLDKGDLVQAEEILTEKAIPLATRIGNESWLSELFDTYSDIFAAKGSFNEAYLYQKQATKKRVEADIRMASNQLRLLSVQLDVKNKELKIQNEEKELLIQSNRIQRMEFWLVITILLIVLSFTSLFWLQQRSRMKLQREQISSAKRIIDMEESEKGRTARELHDITGQLVLGITGEIENLEMTDEMMRELLVERIKGLGQSIRHISHRMNPAMVGNFSFHELISGLCIDMERLTGIMIELDQPDAYPDLPEEMILHIYRISQELITNASKYAIESVVSLKIWTEENNLRFDYLDSGKGFEYDEKNITGMGLMNIFERVKLLNGKAKLITAPGSGTRWNMTFPLGKF